MYSSIRQSFISRVDKAVSVYAEELKGVRTGRASPALLEHVFVEAYGGTVPLSQVGSVNVMDSRMLSVQVWDRGVVKSVEKAIHAANLGVNAIAEGQTVRVPIPPLSEERRKELVKVIAKYAEQTRIAIRNIRRDALDEIKKLEKDGSISEGEVKKNSDDIQKLVEDYNKKIEMMFLEREKEILQV